MTHRPSISPWLPLILLLSLVLRLGWGLHLPTDPSSLSNLPDQREYYELGRNLWHDNSLSFVDLRFGDRVFAYRSPGYPLLIAACGAEIQRVRVVQAFLDTSTVLAVFLLARRWMGSRTSCVPALIVAINPFLIYFTGLLLSETLFTALLVWGVMLFTRRRRWAGAGCVLLCLSVVVRPGTIALPIVAAATAMIAIHRAALRRPKIWFSAASIGLLTVITLFPWAYRNYRVLGEWIWTTTNGGITMYDGFNPQADGSSDQRFIAAMPQLSSMNELQRDHYFATLARRFIIDHPLRSIELGGIKVARMWSPYPLSADYGSHLKYVLISLLFSVPFDLAVLAGLWRGQLPRAAKMYLLTAAVYFTLVHAASVGSLRYRIPAEVPLSVLAADGLCLLLCPRRATNG